MTGTALPRRPIAIVLVQALIVVVILAFVPAIVEKVYPDIPMLWKHDAAGLLLRLAPWLAILVLMLATLWTLWFRKAYGRWLGVPCLALLGVAIVNGGLDVLWMPLDAPQGDQDRALAGRAAALLLLGWWVYIFGFSRKARAFFSGKPA